MSTYLKIAVILITMLNFNMACISNKNISGKQGIMGNVRWLEGNLMPSPGDKAMQYKYKGTPIQRYVYIYPAVKKEDVISGGEQFYKKINAGLISRIKSNNKGYFKINLPPGKYSIFVMEEDGFFANTFDGDGYISPVTVHQNEFTEIQIMVNYKAYY